jgi:hypothetical protein
MQPAPHPPIAAPGLPYLAHMPPPAPIVPPPGPPVPAWVCDRYYTNFRSMRHELRKLFSPELSEHPEQWVEPSPEQIAALQKECRTLWRRYERCMTEKRPGALFRTLHDDEKDEIRWDLKDEDGPLIDEMDVDGNMAGGGSRRSRRSRRSRHTRRRCRSRAKRAARRNTRK